MGVLAATNGVGDFASSALVGLLWSLFPGRPAYGFVARRRCSSSARPLKDAVPLDSADDVEAPWKRALSSFFPLVTFRSSGGVDQLADPAGFRTAAEPLSSTVLAGHARAWRFTKGAWAEAPAYDYDFLVLERRYEGRWDAVKEIHRRDPRYDGRAGPRDQTIFFTVHTSPAAGGGQDLAVQSTLGSGTGHVDAGGDGFVVEMAAARREMFVPFDTVRIRQRPSREGHLEERLRLFRRRTAVDGPS